MEYGKEFDTIAETGILNVFKPKSGLHKLKILEEAQETIFKNQKTGEEIPQIKIKVEFQGKVLDWCVTKGKTKISLYGQIMAIGKYKRKLKGQSIQLMVTSSQNKEGQ